MALVIPELWAILFGIAFLILGLMTFSREMQLRSCDLAKKALKAHSGNLRLAFVHYPSGAFEAHIPEPEEGSQKNAPIWIVDGTKRFRDITGKKWEQIGHIKVINYTARHPTPIATNQAIALDHLSDLLAEAGFSIVGFEKEAYYMIQESAKGPYAEAEAWNKLGVKSKAVANTIRDILEYIRTNREFRYTLFKEGVFTYQTAVSVVDQITMETVAETSNLISFVEDRLRRKMADRFSEVMKYAMIALPIIIVSAIAGVIFLVGTGMVKMG